MKKERKRPRPLLPRLPKELIVEECSNYIFEDEDLVYEKIFEGCEIENQEADKANFKQVVFKNVVFRDDLFRGADMEDVRFENCDLSNIDLSQAILYRCEFENCKMVGANLSEAAFHNTTISRCNASYSNLRFLSCKRVEIRQSIFDFADFQSAKFVDLGFEDTSLRECQMSGSSLCGIDMRTCDIEGIGIRMEDIKGAVVTPIQAVSLSRLMGLMIKDD